jgi:hypothetical protein
VQIISFLLYLSTQAAASDRRGPQDDGTPSWSASQRRAVCSNWFQLPLHNYGVAGAVNAGTASNCLCKDTEGPQCGVHKTRKNVSISKARNNLGSLLRPQPSQVPRHYVDQNSALDPQTFLFNLRIIKDALDNGWHVSQILMHT